MSSPFVITTVEELRDDVGELVQRVYVDEWGKRVAATRGYRRRRSRWTLIALHLGRLVGTARIALGSTVPREERASLRLDHFSRFLPLDQVAVGGRLAVASAMRSSGLSRELVEGSVASAVQAGARLIFTACQPHLLNLYGQLGFRPYCPATSKEGVGVLAPVVLDLTDGDRLARDGSPLARLAQRAGAAGALREAIESAPGWERRCRAPGELGPIEPGLDGLAPGLPPALLRSGYLVPCPSDALVVSRGQAVRTLYLVLEGSLLLDGGRAGAVAAGEFAGAPSYLLGVRQPHDLRAGPEGARLLALPAQALAGQVDDDGWAEALVVTLAETIQRRLSGGGVR